MSYNYHQQNTQGGPPQWDHRAGSNNDYYGQGPPPIQNQGQYQGQHQDQNQGQNRGFMDHIPFTSQHTQHEAQKHGHPLQYLLNKEGTKIVLDFVEATRDDGDGDKLMAASRDEDSYKPVYVIRYNGDNYSGWITGSAAPDFNPDNMVDAGSWDTFENRKDKLKFIFPWLTWSLDPQESNWTSDVGLLGGKDEMHFIFTDESGGEGNDDKSHVDFTLRCVDMSDSERRLVSKLVLRGYAASIALEIPVKIIASKQQLDEIVVVTWAVADWYRDQILNGTL